MRITPSLVYKRFQPSRCVRRLQLAVRQVEEGPTSPYVDVLRALGERYEADHLDTFPEFVDLSDGSLSDRIERTQDALQWEAPVLYQPVLTSPHPTHGQGRELFGIPDLLIRSGDGWVVRDVKLARSAEEKDHPEIGWQLQLYGLLLELVTGEAPAGMEALLGTEEIVQIDYKGSHEVLAFLDDLAAKANAEPAYEPVGWSKCGACGYHDRCWPEAEDQRDVALVLGVDQNLAHALHAREVFTITDLRRKLTEPELAEVRKPWGTRTQRVGKAAGSILKAAEALDAGKVMWLAAPAIPKDVPLAVFDLEGLPPDLDELDRVFLWGFKVCRPAPGPYQGIYAGLGSDGDREGWERFLAAAQVVLDAYPGIRWLHWHHYERVKLETYIDRYGDPTGLGRRVIDALLDLLPVTKQAVVLPLSSYSLKVVEKYVGFTRRLPEGRGDWAMARFIQATECEGEEERQGILAEIRRYNEEDLDATWAVHEWLSSQSPWP